jgi:uncharacterized membrane protein HdeD (DUF308 family)
MHILVGFLLLVLGGISIVDPRRAWEIKTYIGKKFMGVTYKATDKTYQFTKLLGILYILVGLFVLSSV